MIRILFANPNQKLSEIYVNHMKNHFLVDSVHDGLAALRSLKLTPQHLIVSDYHLPLFSGLGLLKFVREHHSLGSTPFVFLSNFHDNTQALNLGANDWLDQKDTNPDYLLNRIFHHLKTNKYGIQIHRA